MKRGRWTGGYERKDKGEERPEADAPTSVRYTVVLTPFLEAVSGRILRNRETIGTFSAPTTEEAEWLAQQIAGTYSLPKRYD